MFKKDETEMPTTQMLLWRNEIISPEYHNEIAAKVKETFGRKLPTRKEEEADHGLSKMRIAEIVSQIRQNCRGDEILRQYNIEFGFFLDEFFLSFDWKVIPNFVCAVFGFEKEFAALLKRLNHIVFFDE